ncbi:hypothetical protein Agub_g12504 [Astrephomene gubernaculifera]|uniref:Pherophorin domain-containing protein n=1 Tax=Astrephomene gubernaculifera TaxID=47775 RepID=A0AAD3E2T5_9CHLO|nr:hypothetical protein Agub_g12504 [Astrephomene gubernaculifera]
MLHFKLPASWLPPTASSRSSSASGDQPPAASAPPLPQPHPTASHTMNPAIYGFAAIHHNEEAAAPGTSNPEAPTPAEATPPPPAAAAAALLGAMEVEEVVVEPAGATAWRGGANKVSPTAAAVASGVAMKPDASPAPRSIISKRCVIIIFAALAAFWLAAAGGVLAGVLVTRFRHKGHAAQPQELPGFPYQQCSAGPSPYSLAPAVRMLGPGQYCFRLNTSGAVGSTAAAAAGGGGSGCSGYCCAEADLQTIEFDVYSACNVPGVDVRATVNGVPTRVTPAFTSPAQGPPDSTLLRLSGLGLNRASEGAEVCLFLKPNRQGLGCTSLEQLCTAPGDMAVGVCSVALLDFQNACCPVSLVNRGSSGGMTAVAGALPPPPTSLRPTSPPPPPPPPPTSSVPPARPSPSPTPSSCAVCIYYTVTYYSGYSQYITGSVCNSVAGSINADIGSFVTGTKFVPTACGQNSTTFCGTFASYSEAANLQFYLSYQVKQWASYMYTSSWYCSTVVVTVGAPNSNPLYPAPTCVSAAYQRDC